MGVPVLHFLRPHAASWRPRSCRGYSELRLLAAGCNGPVPGAAAGRGRAVAVHPGGRGELTCTFCRASGTDDPLAARSAPCLSSCLIATPFGSLAFWLTSPHRRCCLASASLSWSSLSSSGAASRLKSMPGRAAAVATGAVSGLFNGAFSTGGPPVILFYFASPAGNIAGRASLIGLFSRHGHDRAAAAGARGPDHLGRRHSRRDLPARPCSSVSGYGSRQSFKGADPALLPQMRPGHPCGACPAHPVQGIPGDEMCRGSKAAEDPRSRNPPNSRGWRRPTISQEARPVRSNPEKRNAAARRLRGFPFRERCRGRSVGRARSPGSRGKRTPPTTSSAPSQMTTISASCFIPRLPTAYI